VLSLRPGVGSGVLYIGLMSVELSLVSCGVTRRRMPQIGCCKPSGEWAGWVVGVIDR
jgi:hypothetical protein